MQEPNKLIISNLILLRIWISFSLLQSVFTTSHLAYYNGFLFSASLLFPLWYKIHASMKLEYQFQVFSMFPSCPHTKIQNNFLAYIHFKCTTQINKQTQKSRSLTTVNLHLSSGYLNNSIFMTIDNMPHSPNSELSPHTTSFLLLPCCWLLLTDGFDFHFIEKTRKHFIESARKHSSDCPLYYLNFFLYLHLSSDSLRQKCPSLF